MNYSDLSQHPACCNNIGKNKATWIDTHAHLWPKEYLDELEVLGSLETSVARNIGATDSYTDIKARLDMMDKAGVKYQLLSATPQTPQWGKADDSAKLAQMINDVYACLVNKYPDRFMAYGIVPLPHVDEAIKEARRCINKLGFKGIAINAIIANELSVANDRFLPFYEELDRLNTILYIHPTGCGSNSPMVNDFGLEWVVGAPIEDTLAALQLLKADIPYKYPNICFHIAHLGGTLAFMMQRIEDNFSEWKAFKRSPWGELRKFYFDTANFHIPALKCMIETFGHTHLLLGSDFPYFQYDKYTRAVTYIQQSGLSESDVRAILLDNALDLFRKSNK